MKQYISIRGARQHNLKNIDVDIPRDKLVVLTGISGSGKSSLAFDTIYSEGQRRFVESLSAYARQFLGQMDKPDVDHIEGLSPAISIDQKTTNKNPRSTVGTVTEIYDYLRLLYVRAGTPYCPNCGRQIVKSSLDEIVDRIMKLPEGSRLWIEAPVVRGRKGSFQSAFKQYMRQGYVRFRVDGDIFDAEELPELAKNKNHEISVVIDRLILKPDIQKRVAESVEHALTMTEGLVEIQVGTLPEDGDELQYTKHLYSQNNVCPNCDISLGDITPRFFSFNSPYGACKACDGLGFMQYVDESLILGSGNLSLSEGVIRVGGWNVLDPTTRAWSIFSALSKKYRFSLDTPFKNLSADIRYLILHGVDAKGNMPKLKLDMSQNKYHPELGSSHTYEYMGLIPNIEKRYRETKSTGMGVYYEQFFSYTDCQSCHGARLRPEALSVRIQDLNIFQLTELPIGEALLFLESLHLSVEHQAVVEKIVREVKTRIQFLLDVGLDYITLSRASATLSGGESQRIRLATQIGSGLMGVLYILDEPSIGLHQRDNTRLLGTLKHLRDLGNTVLVVEHDLETIAEADFVLDIGPGAGEHGGEVVGQGTAEDLVTFDRSLTGQYLSGKLKIEVPETRRKGNGLFIKVKGAKENNLKNINVDFPLGTFTCVTGVSGSGKSTLIDDILLKGLEKELNGSRRKMGKHTSIEGIQALDKVISIDQSPIGRTPRSNPVTYTGTFDLIRSLFAETKEAKSRGYQMGRFSFNVRGGRCEACNGDGVKRIEMHFLADIYVRCEICKGKRYNRETLEVKFKGKNIADILDLTVTQALEFFADIPKIARKLKTLESVGLGYIHLGQPSTQLSGGEAQRVKLATELSKRSTGKTIYIMDEPTTGLHIADVHRLVDIVHQLVDKGNTVIIIEHNLDLIKTADYVVDLGPEGGFRGGTVVAKGTPEAIAKVKASYTGKYLKTVL